MSIEFPGMPERSWSNFDGWAGSWNSGGGWSTPALGLASPLGREAQAAHDQRVVAAFAANQAQSQIDRMQAAAGQGGTDPAAAAGAAAARTQAAGQQAQAAIAAGRFGEAAAVLRTNPQLVIQQPDGTRLYGEAAARMVEQRGQVAAALPHLQLPELRLAELALPPLPASLLQGARPPYVDVAELGGEPPELVGGAGRQATGGRAAPVPGGGGATPPPPSAGGTTAAGLPPQPTAGERAAVEAAIAQGAAGGRVVGTTPQELGVSSWAQTDPGSIGRAIYIRAD